MLIIRLQNAIYMQNQNNKTYFPGHDQNQAWTVMACDCRRV